MHPDPCPRLQHLGQFFPSLILVGWLPPQRSPPSENNGHLQARRCKRTSVEEHGVGGVSAMAESSDVAHHGRMGKEVKEAQREPKSALSSAIPQRTPARPATPEHVGMGYHVASSWEWVAAVTGCQGLGPYCTSVALTSEPKGKAASASLPRG